MDQNKSETPAKKNSFWLDFGPLLIFFGAFHYLKRDYPDDAIEMGQKSVRIANDLYQARAEMAQMLCMSTILIKVPELSAVAFEREAWTERGSTTRVFVPSLSIEP